MLYELITDYFYKLQQYFNTGVIGIDFAYDKANFVQLKQQNNTLIIKSFISIDYDCAREQLFANKQEMQKLIKRAFKLGNFNTNKIITAMPSADVQLLPISYQLEKDQEQTAAVINVLSKKLKAALAEYVIDYIPIRNNSETKQCQGNAIIVKKDKVVSLLENLRKSGLNCVCLDITSAALKRLIHNTPNISQSDNVMVINIAYYKAEIIVVSGRRILFHNELEIGEKDIIHNISASLDIDKEKARALLYKYGIQLPEHLVDSQDKELIIAFKRLAKNNLLAIANLINKATLYAVSESRGKAIGKTFLLGNIANCNGIATELSRLINLPIVIPSYLKYFGVNASSQQQNINLSAAVGLALRGLV